MVAWASASFASNSSTVRGMVVAMGWFDVVDLASLIERESSSLLFVDWGPIVERRVSGVKVSSGGDGDRCVL